MFSVLSFGSPITFPVSAGFPWNVFNFLADRLSLDRKLLLPGDPGACKIAKISLKQPLLVTNQHKF